MEPKDVFRSGLLLLVFLITAFQIRPTQSQLDQDSFGRPAYCLLNRLEVVGCNRRFPGRTRFPNKNQYGEYSTRIRSSSAGAFRCYIRNKNHIVRDIPTFPMDVRLKFLFSPGIRISPDPVNYGNQIFVRYNVSCPDGHLAFFNISQINMEPPNCFNVNRNQTQCVDYVRVVRPTYGNTESCGGNTIEDNQNRLEEGNLDIILRTNDNARYPGFEATVVCFDQGLRDMPGCTRPADDGTVSVDMSASSSTRRRRRDLEEFHNKWKRHLARLKRRRRRQAALKIRFMTINVQFGVDVFYRQKELTFRLRDGGMQPEGLEPIKDIFVINTFDVNGNTTSFVEKAVAEDGRELALQGPGPLTIVGNYAYFQLFVIDPRGITPTPAEMVAISNLTQAQYALVTEENTTRQNPEELNPDCTELVKDLNLPPNPDVTLSPECPQRAKRQANMIMSDMLQDSAIITAILNENACNPILRTSADATVKFMEMADNERLQRLRESVENMRATTAPPMMATTPNSGG